MKKKNYIQIYILLIFTFNMIGCLPDSLTKYDKDTTQKEATIPPPTFVEGEEGEKLEFANINPITTFYMTADGNKTSPFYYKLGDSVTLAPYMNGDFGLSSEAIRKKLFKSCRLIGTNTTLPYGFIFYGNKAETPCQISGSAQALRSNDGNGIQYTMELKTIGRDGIEHTITTNFSIGVFKAPSKFSYVEPNKLILKFDNIEALSSIRANLRNSAAPYSANGYVSTLSGANGVIKAIDLNQGLVAINKIIELRINTLDLSLPVAIRNKPLLANDSSVILPYFLCSPSGAIARVIRTKTSTGHIYVELLNDISFSTISGFNSVGFSNSETCSDSFVYNTYVAAIATPKDFTSTDGDSSLAVDFKYEFQNPIASVSNIQFAYEVDKEIRTTGGDYPALRIKSADLNDSLDSSLNGIRFRVMPSLPEGINILNDGTIEGVFTDVIESAEYTITAYNHVAESSRKIILNAQKRPKDLSYTQSQLLSISSHSGFQIGQTIQEIPANISPLDPNLLKRAQIIDKYEDTNSNPLLRQRIAIYNKNGAFKEDNKFYSHIAYSPLIPYVLGPKTTFLDDKDFVTNFNVAIEIPFATTLSNTFIGDYVKGTSSNAVGKIVYIYEQSSIGKKIIFIQSLLDPSFELNNFRSDESFCATDDLGGMCKSGASTVSISALVSNSYLLTLPSSVTSAMSHRDFESSAKEWSFYSILNPYRPASTNQFWITEISRDPSVATPAYITTSDTVSVTNITPVTNHAITRVQSASNYFLAERGEPLEINVNITNTEGVFYSISPDLPEGLNLNTATGIISGTPTKKMELQKFEVTAYNLVGVSYYKLHLEVRDYFKLKNTSFPTVSYLHKTGSHAHTRECKIDANSISRHKGTIEVLRTCYLDAEELDLHYYGLNLNLTAGESVCNFVRYSPFSFWKAPPIATAGTAYPVKSACSNQASLSGSMTPPDITLNSVCRGNYQASGGENCDEGYITVQTLTPNETGACSAGVYTSEVVECGGKKVSCMSGAIVDALSREQIEAGGRRLLSPANSSGVIDQSYKVADAYSIPSKSNYHAANYLRQTVTGCGASFSDTNSLITAMANAFEDTHHPFAKLNPYYTFSCLDGGSEPISALRVIVRDWNMQFNLTDDIDAFTPTSSKFAASGVDPIIGEEVNSYNAWKDKYSNASSFYGAAGTACGTTPDSISPGARYPTSDY